MCFNYTIQQQKCGHLVNRIQPCDLAADGNPENCPSYHRYSLINVVDICAWCHAQDALAEGLPITDEQAKIPKPDVIIGRLIQPRNVESYEVAGNRSSLEASASVPAKKSKNPFKGIFGTRGEANDNKKCAVM